MANLTGPVWMTPAALAALEAELAELTAHPSDDDAVQARILEVREIIRHAEIGTKPDDGLVEPGMRITVKFHADDSIETFLLGSRDVVKGGDIEVYSPTSPLGSAIDGHRVGDVVSFTAPSGASLTVTIVAATPYA